MFHLLSPTLISSGLFMAFTRIQVHLNATSFYLCPTRLLTLALISGNQISFAIQTVGMSLLVRGKTQDSGFGHEICGFSLQTTYFTLSILLILKVNYLIRKSPTNVSMSLEYNDIGLKYNNWRFFYLCLL